MSYYYDWLYERDFDGSMFHNGRGNGWDSCKNMSVNAADAYEFGEKPKSKWTKKAIINGILNRLDEEKDLMPAFNPDALNKYTKHQLFTAFMRHSGWHHTSPVFNETDFYEVSDELIESTTDDMIAKIPALDKPRVELGRNMYVTARVDYTVSRKTSRCGSWHTVWIEDEIVHYMSHDKMVKTAHGRKRLSSLIIKTVREQKTCFPADSKVMERKKK